MQSDKRINDKGISTFKVAATYIGTVVGAGFASGQEILQFFSVFGNMGLIGLIIVTFLFIIFGYIIMELGLRLNSKSHIEIIKHTGGRYIGTAIDYIITFFLFGALTAMIAGSGAMISQQFGIPSIWGNILMAIATAITVLSGLYGVINSISFVVPFLILAALGVSIGSFLVPGGQIIQTAEVTPSNLIQNWLWAAVLYVSYNTVLSIAVLGPLGANAKNKRSIRYGAILGGIGLGVGAIAINLALLNNINTIMNIEVPMAYIAGQISYFIQIIYIIVLLAEVYTTAVGSLFGFAARLENTVKLDPKILVISSVILALIASQLGFSNLVKYLYPAVGYGGVFLLATLIYSKLKRRRTLYYE